MIALAELVLLASLQATPGPVAETATQAPVSQTTNKTYQDAEVDMGDPKTTVCKKFPPPIGSRIGARRICMTRAEWKTQREEILRTMDGIQNRHAGPAGG